MATDFGKWIGGMMSAANGAGEAIPRARMVADVIAAAKRSCPCDRADLLVFAVPAGNGQAFMDRIALTLGENAELMHEVVL